jgi:putative transposase
MTKLRRYSLPGPAYYVYQRGRSGNLCFFDEACCDYYLRRLTCSLKAYGIILHSYVLLPDELQLLVTPYSCSGILRLLGSLGSDYSGYFRNRFNRDCSLGRSSPALTPLRDDGNLVLDCQKYIELAPVRRKLVDNPGEWTWSAYRINAFGGHDGRLSAHAQYRRLVETAVNPFQAYRDFIAEPLSASQRAFMEHRLRLAYPVRGWNRLAANSAIA